jgi:uncharacterized metal-binding protein YceD (DUF177 family)
MTSPYTIPFVGLKLGQHLFDFALDKTFFESLPYSLVDDGKLVVKLNLEKKETMLIASFEVKGVVSAPCARCNEEMDQKIKGDLTVYFVLGEEESEDENLIVIPKESYEIDVQQSMYEMIMLALPARSAHKKNECNEEMVQLIQKYTSNQVSKDEENNIDPRWAALKNLN